MCGIAGIISADPERARAALDRADRAQAHRGPDGNGFRVDQVATWHVGLGHRRLSVIDLSTAGAQPMVSRDDSQVIVFNGEIYNYREIRADLVAMGRPFQSASDTEVLLESLGTWGDASVSRCNGMWAFAWLDRKRRRLVLCRDRLGVKPLYVYRARDAIYFASEIKAILEMSGEKFALDRQVIGEYAIQSLHDTSERTFYEGIVKLSPGSIAEILLDDPRLEMRTTRFWEPATTESESGAESAIENIRSLLMDSVSLRLRSDVPVGILLSGGVDSSAIAACMQKILGPDANLNLLSAVSNGSQFDEAPFIDLMASHLRLPVNKMVLDLDSQSALELLARMTWFNDEPVGGFSNIAHFLLMERARELGITVILSGQGADETFCGYRKFLGFHLQSLLRQGRVLRGLADLLGFVRTGTVLSQFSWQEARRYLPSFSPRLLGVTGAALADYVPVDSGLPPGASLQDRQVSDVRRFSIPILTHYEDRSSMAWSREVRAPFLDYRLVDAALSLPPALKLARGWTKYALRKAMESLLPPQIAWRKDKQNFVNPQSEWLKTELKPAVLGIYSDPQSLIYRHQLYAQDRLVALYDRYCRQPVNAGAVSFKQIVQPLALEIWLRGFSRYLS